MKNIIVTITLLLSFASFAQNKFIEVEVTDTISLKPVSFKLNAYSDPYRQLDFGESETYNPAIAHEKAKNKLEAAKKTLEAKKYKVLPLDNSGIGILEKRNATNDGFTIMVNGLSEVKKLEETIKAIGDIETIVTVLKYADEQKAEEKLINRLIEKAKAKAKVIATASGLKEGRIYEVKEGRGSNPTTEMSDIYTQIAKMGNWMSQGSNYTGSISKTFIVKFSAE